MDALIGQKLGKYKIDRLLAEGGMGAVYQAQDTILARTVAIKVMHRQFSQRQDFQERFLQEARTAARLNHPGIVKVHAFEKIDGLLLIVMEIIQGEDLQQVLESMVEDRQWLELPQAVKLIVQVGMALDYAHRQGVLHRDIKPANIMLKSDLENPGYFQPILTDLGLAKLAEGAAATQGNVAMGTPAYMSPEQAMGKPTDARSDVYSLGVLLYELAVGKRPFPIRSLSDALRYHVREPAPRPRLVNPSLPPVLEQVILRMLEKNPAQRYASALAVAQHLSTIPASILSVPVPAAAVAGARSMVIMALSSLGTERAASVAPAVQTSPVGSTHPTLEIFSPNGAARTLNIKRRTMTIGRDDRNDIILLDDRVSRQHAKVEFDGVHCRVTDLKSSNGSYVGQTKLAPGVAELLPPGVMLRLGDHRLRFVPAAPPPLPQWPLQPALTTYGATVTGSPSGATMPFPGVGEPFRLAQTSYAPESMAMQPQTTIAAGSQWTEPQTIMGGGTQWMQPAAARRRRPRPLYVWLISLLAVMVVAGGGWLLLFRSQPPTASLVALLRPFGLSPSVTLPAASPTWTPAPEPTFTSVPATPAPPSVTPVEEVAGPLPDLVIMEMVATPRNGKCDDGGGVELKVVVANLGEVAAGAFVVAVNGISQPVDAGLAPPLDVTVYFDNYNDSNKATVDPDGVVQESREDNNQATIDSGAGVVSTCVPTPTPTETPTSTPSPTPTSTEIVVEPSLPPASTDLMIAYVNGNNGVADVYIYEVESGQSRPVAANSSCDEAEPRWFPGAGAHEARLLYQSNCDGSYDFYAVNVATGEVERLTQTAGYDEWEANISPNGASIVFRRSPHAPPEQERNNIGDIFRLELASGATTPLAVRGRAPVWSPNGEQLAYMSNESGSWQIYRYDFASGVTELVSTNCPMHCRWPAWLPDGKSLSYSVADEGMFPKGIWIAPFGQEPYEWLAGEVGRVAWSETNQAVFNSDQGIETIGFDRGNRKVVVSNLPNSPPNVSPFWNR